MSGALTLSDLLGDRSAMRAPPPPFPEEVGLSLAVYIGSAHVRVNASGGHDRAPKTPALRGGQVAASAAWGEVSSVTRKVASMLKAVIMIRPLTTGLNTQHTERFKATECN